MEAVEDIKKELMAELEKVKLEIQANMQAGGVNASGQTSKSLKVVPYESGVRLISDGTGAPFSTVEAGRKPGKVPYNFVDIIFQWSKIKVFLLPMTGSGEGLRGRLFGGRAPFATRGLAGRRACKKGICRTAIPAMISTRWRCKN